MKTSIYILFLLIILSSCGVHKHIPTITQKDTTIIHLVDSVRITDSIRIIPIERIVDVVAQYDTLKMETSLAKASAYVDTTMRTLKGTIENKKDFTQQTTTKVKIVRDTVIRNNYVQVPVEVERIKYIIPTWCWITMLLGGVCAVILIGKLF